MGDCLDEDPVVEELVLLPRQVQLRLLQALLRAHILLKEPNVENWQGTVQEVEKSQEPSFIQGS